MYNAMLHFMYAAILTAISVKMPVFLCKKGKKFLYIPDLYKLKLSPFIKKMMCLFQ